PAGRHHRRRRLPRARRGPHARGLRARPGGGGRADRRSRGRGARGARAARRARSLARGAARGDPAGRPPLGRGARRRRVSTALLRGVRMAGVGLPLRRMLADDSYAGLLGAYGYAGLVSAGPWVLSIVGMLAIGAIASGSAGGRAADLLVWI